MRTRSGHARLARRAIIVICAAALGAAGLSVPVLAANAALIVSASSVASGGIWGNAMPVPGLAVLDVAESPTFGVLSCSSVGNCSAGGGYTNAARSNESFVVSERDGHWGRAIEVPGTGALNKGLGNSTLLGISCRSVGNCSAGGSYADGKGHEFGYVVSEKNGHWETALKVRGLPAPAVGTGSAVEEVSCGSPGNCTAAGSYGTTRPVTEAFVISQRNGVWGKVIELPGIASLNNGGNADVTALSCASAGNCAAGGFYSPGGSALQAYVASEKNGRWSKAIEVPGIAALNKSRNAMVSSVWCSAAGQCVAGGSYTGRSAMHPFVVAERNGTWGRSTEVTGSAVFNASVQTAVESLSCASRVICSAGGSYFDSSGNFQAFVVTDRDGRWGKAVEVPGTAALNKGGLATVVAMSCVSPGICTATGTYSNKEQNSEPFVVSEQNGKWRTAFEQPGIAALGHGQDAAAGDISCPAAGRCVTVGIYSTKRDDMQGYTASQR